MPKIEIKQQPLYKILPSSASFRKRLQLLCFIFSLNKSFDAFTYNGDSPGTVKPPRPRRLPPSSPGEGEENFEKRPVFKKVKDKAKKIKSAIAKKARSYGGNGNNDDDVDQHQHDDLDEGDEEDEELPEDNAIHGDQSYESSTVDGRIGAKEGGRGVANEGLFESSADAAKTREYETGRGGGGTEEVYGSSPAGERSESIGTPSGGGTAGVYGNSTAGAWNGLNEPRREEGGEGGNHGVYGSSTPGERSRMNEAGSGRGTEGVIGSSTAGMGTGESELGTGGGGGRTEVNSAGLSGIKPELKEDPAAPNSSTRTEMEQSRGGEEAAISPDLISSLEAIGTSGQNGSGSKDLSDDTNRNNASVIPGANEAGGEGRAISPISPELHRSFNAMSVSDPDSGGAAEVPQNKNSSYADRFSAAKDAAFSAASESAVLGKKVASMVYQKAAGAGTAVMATVKPETGNDGVKPEIVKEDRDLAAGKQDKGGSVKDYVSGKLAPGEEDKALSEVITEALTPRKGDAVEAAAPVSPETSGSRGSGGGIGVVGRIKETVTSFLGGGGSPRESPAADESKDFLGRTPEALSQEKAP
ncbi:Low-temperature-induced 65 kDa protein [Platanthera zijinensis]|uniref:Low-temperature-induced 65 kDa protein n=1 Tax=Platanthera zijinensis TaxID=2320716 RepID=A0AAP0BG84_9ASPA